MRTFSLFSQRGFLLRCSLCLRTLTGCTNGPHWSAGASHRVVDISWLIGRDYGKARGWWCARCGVPFLCRRDKLIANIHVGYAHAPPQGISAISPRELRLIVNLMSGNEVVGAGQVVKTRRSLVRGCECLRSGRHTGQEGVQCGAALR